MTAQLTRAQAPKELTWDLTALFKTPADFKAGCEQLQAQIQALKPLAATFTNDAAHFEATLQAYYQADRLLERLFIYAELSTAQDTTDAQAQQFMAQAQQLDADAQAATAWLEPAVVALPEERLAAFQQTDPKLVTFTPALAAMRTRSGHVLPPDQEALLGTLSQSFSVPETVQSTLDDADLTFGQIDFNGQQALTKGLMGLIGVQGDRPTRKQASSQMDAAYYDHRYTFAATLNAEMHTQNQLAKVRHYDSARAMDLGANQIPEQVYDLLIGRTRAHLPLLHRYFALRKKVLGLPTMYRYDLNVPLTKGELPFKPTYDEAKQTALQALAPLGDDYLAHLKDEFAHRWVDVLETKGKTSGGFETGAYRVHPYILLNWADSYGDMSTLVHESGHAMQTVYSDAAQPYWASHYPIFTAEIASTTNESLLNAYLLAQSQDDPAKQKFLLTESVNDFYGTVFRQTEFAEFEQFMYETEAAGTPLTPTNLTEKWDELDRAYYGPALSATSWPAVHWAQIPHFFYEYYVYQYATSKAIATAFAQRILNDGPSAVAAYKHFLAAGASASPTQILQEAGIDVTKPAYLDAAFGTFERQLEQLEALFN